MKRLLLLPIAVVLLATLAWADDPALPPTAAERAQMFQRDRALIQVLVRGGLRLAAEEDPLGRADSCADLAEQLASEIRQAAESRQGDRAAELGDHLRALLNDGVDVNLSGARNVIPPGSAEEKKLQTVSKRAMNLKRFLDDRLPQP